MKKLIKSVVFIALFCIIWNCVFKVLRLEPTSISYFYDEPKDSLDVVYIGASNVYNHFNATLAYNKYGLKTGILSTASQPAAYIKYLIEESSKYQSPKVYVVDLVGLTYDDNLLLEGEIRKVSDSMKYSQNRTDALNYVLSYTDIPKKDYINYYYSFLKYHAIWKNVTKTSFTKVNETSYKGYNFAYYNSVKVEQEKSLWCDFENELTEANHQVLNDLIEYLNLNNVEVLFVIPSRNFTEKECGRMNYAARILEENNYSVINFNTLKDFTVDYKNDFYDIMHLNVYGATKYTLYFSKYLNENYDLNDHRDEGYCSWDKEYERFTQDFKSLMGINFDELLKEYDIY